MAGQNRSSRHQNPVRWKRGCPGSRGIFGDEPVAFKPLLDRTPGRSISRLKTNAIAGDPRLQLPSVSAASAAVDRQRIPYSSGLSARDDGQLALSMSCPPEESGWVRQRRGIDDS